MRAAAAAAAGLGLLWGLPVSAQVLVPDSVRQRAAQAPLFASHQALRLTIEGPLDAIFKERGQKSEEYPGKVIVHRGDGDDLSLDAQVRTRGKARLSRRICAFPPLRLNFPKSRVASTVFEHQDKLKLVGHCQDNRSEYEQYVLQEYLAYRILNLLTDVSFRVRLARITYRDTEARRDTVTRWGFLIEPDEMLAARNGWLALAPPAVPPETVDPEYLALTEVFQYFIGNPDWSAFASAPDEPDCCHNTQPIGDPAGPVFSVPYDFDITGIVNTRYADQLFQPRERNLGIRRVRERVYRGLCPSLVFLPEVFALFNAKRDAIYALYREQPGLDPKIVEETAKYLDEFYQTINDTSKARREFDQKCRG